MDALAEKLDARLREWKLETAAEARERITEVIELADHDVLDVARSRAAQPGRSGWPTWDSLPKRVPSSSQAMLKPLLRQAVMNPG